MTGKWKIMSQSYRYKKNKKTKIELYFVLSLPTKLSGTGETNDSL